MIVPLALEFDGWLKANAAVGLMLAIAVLAMAVAGLFSRAGPTRRPNSRV